MALIKCDECDNEMENKTKVCPSCGTPNKKANDISVVTAIITISAAILLYIYLFSGSSSTKPVEIDTEMQALHICRNKIMSVAKFPSSVDIALFDTTSHKNESSGDTAVNISFESKNGFGNKLPYRAYCMISENGKIDTFKIFNR